MINRFILGSNENMCICIYLIIYGKERCITFRRHMKYLLGLQENTSTDKKYIEAYGINRYLFFFLF